ncbi:MAG: hypothetical protein HQL77_16095 [Magnetococcales bacterium]|nr:hypothetical protein [Magnetococcales bacterium]
MAAHFLSAWNGAIFPYQASGKLLERVGVDITRELVYFPGKVSGCEAGVGNFLRMGGHPSSPRDDGYIIDLSIINCAWFQSL